MVAIITRLHKVESNEEQGLSLWYKDTSPRNCGQTGCQRLVKGAGWFRENVEAGLTQSG